MVKFGQVTFCQVTFCQVTFSQVTFCQDTFRPRLFFEARNLMKLAFQIIFKHVRMYLIFL